MYTKPKHSCLVSRTRNYVCFRINNYILLTNKLSLKKYTTRIWSSQNSDVHVPFNTFGDFHVYTRLTEQTYWTCRPTWVFYVFVERSPSEIIQVYINSTYIWIYVYNVTQLYGSNYNVSIHSIFSYCFGRARTGRRAVVFLRQWRFYRSYESIRCCCVHGAATVTSDSYAEEKTVSFGMRANRESRNKTTACVSEAYTARNRRRRMCALGSGDDVFLTTLVLSDTRQVRLSPLSILAKGRISSGNPSYGSVFDDAFVINHAASLVSQWNRMGRRAGKNKTPLNGHPCTTYTRTSAHNARGRLRFVSSFRPIDSDVRYRLEIAISPADSIRNIGLWQHELWVHKSSSHRCLARWVVVHVRLRRNRKNIILRVTCDGKNSPVKTGCIVDFGRFTVQRNGVVYSKSNGVRTPKHPFPDNDEWMWPRMISKYDFPPWLER